MRLQVVPPLSVGTEMSIALNHGGTENMEKIN